MSIRWMMVLGLGLLVGVAAVLGVPALKSERISEQNRLSYALGMRLGNQLQMQSVTVEPEILGQGLKDALSGGKTLLTEQEVHAVVAGLQDELKKKQPALQAEKRRVQKELAEKNKKAGVKDVQTGATLTDIELSYKLDPRLTKGMYMGERWVSPPTYTRLQDGKTATVEARAQGVDAQGKPRNINPKWIAVDPGMVTVTPGEGNEVKITVQRAGKSTLRVASDGVSKELSVTAAYRGNAMQVEISPIVKTAPVRGES